MEEVIIEKERKERDIDGWRAGEGRRAVLSYFFVVF